MASLDSNFQIGDSGVSSLVKSAATLQNEISTYDDDEAAIVYENSAKTDADFQVYSTYLDGRVTSLSNTGSITDATRALTMSQKIVSAQKSNISANVQRASIGVLAGSASDQDKYNAIVSGYQQLVSIGDLSGAQTLEAQAYSLSQTIQLDAANAATAASALESANAASITDAVTQKIDQLNNANAAFAAQGPKYLDKASATYLKSIGLSTKDVATITSAAAGVVGMVNKGVTLSDASKYAQGTYTSGSVLDLYTQAIAADPTKAQTYQDDIDNYLNGKTSVPVGGSSITYNGLMNAVYASNNNQSPLTTVQAADGTYQVKTQNVTGYIWGKDQNGAPKLMPSYSLFTPTLPTDIKNTFSTAGMNVKADSNGNYWFQATSSTPWLSKVIGNTPTAGAIQADGSVEFMVNGQLMVMVNENGKFGIQQVGQNGKVTNANVAGQYGFTPTEKTTNKVSQSNSISLAGSEKTVNNPDTITINGAPAPDDTKNPINNTKGITGRQSYIPGLGTSNIVNLLSESQNLTRLNIQHNTTMQATAPPNFTPPPMDLTVNTAPTPTIKLNTGSDQLANLGKVSGAPNAAGTKQLNQDATGTPKTVGSTPTAGANDLMGSSNGGISIAGAK